MYIRSEQKSDKKFLNAKYPTGNVLKIETRNLRLIPSRSCASERRFNKILNYAMDNRCFRRVPTHEAVILYHISTTYDYKLYSL